MARAKPGPTIREENERALLEAAESIFAEQGFAGAPPRHRTKRFRKRRERFGVVVEKHETVDAE